MAWTKTGTLKSPTSVQKLATGPNLTAAATLAADTFYTVDATGGTFNLTLPAAPAQGSRVRLWRTDSNTIYVNVYAGAGDSIADVSPGAWQMFRGAGGIEFHYSGTTWYPIPIIGGISGLAPRAANAANPGTIPIRDGNGNIGVGTPIGTTQATPKSYVDGAVRRITANATANNRDFILADATAAPITVTIPVTAGIEITVKKIDASANAVTVVPASGTIDGDPSAILVGTDTSAMFNADGTNAYVEAVYGLSPPPTGVWTAYNPTLTQASNGALIASTLNYAKYLVIGKTCFVHGDLTANAGTSGGAVVDLPLISKDRLINCGTLGVYGATTPADQSGQAYMSSDKSKLVVVAYTGGYRDIVSGAVVRWSVTYELP